MDSLTENEIAEGNSNIEECRSLKQIVGLSWISEILSRNQERMKVHPLVWFLLDKERSHRLQIWLRILARNFPNSKMGKFSKIINKMKKATTEEKFYSILSEIEVGSFYAKKFPIEYEPCDGVDWKITIERQPVYLEVTRLFWSKDAKHSSPLNNKRQSFPPQIIEFKRLDTAGRLKKKIMDEAEKLPIGKLCIVVCNVSRINLSYHYHVEDACKGQRGVQIHLKEGTHMCVRFDNGVFKEKIGDRITAVVAFEDFHYENKSLYPNEWNAKFPLPSNIKEKL
jgi:hypothetical protein